MNTPPRSVLTPDPDHPPAVEPVELDEALLFLRAGTPAESGLIADLLKAARVECEARTNRSFVRQGWILTMDWLPIGGYYGQGYWPDLAIELPRGPLISVDSVTFRDTAGVATTLDPSIYVVEPGTPGRLGPAYGATFPIGLPQIASVVVRFTCGYGPDAASVPPGIRTAIKVLASHYYFNRSADADLPRAVDSLLGPFAWSTYA